MITAHSEYGTIQSILLNPAINAFQSQFKIDKEWEPLNYLDSVDFNESISEYKAFQTYFEKLDAKIHLLPKAETSLDAIYCRDASLATDFGMILCNMGKADRGTEPNAQKAYFKQQRIEVFGSIEGDGTLEGGDMCWLDQKTLAVGHTYRSNLEGIEQLKSFLNPKGIEVLVVDLPHYKGKEDVFHLMSIISPIDKNLAVIYSPLMPIGFRNELLSRGFDFVECPDEEFESMGCNVLTIAPREVLVTAGNPITTKRLEKAGCKVHIYKGQQISQKGCGGPTCLTRPLMRRIEA